MSGTKNSPDRPVRDVWLLFGNVQGYNSIDDALLSGDCDIIPLKAHDIALLAEVRKRSGKIPEQLFARSPLPFIGAASCIDDIQELAYWINAQIGRANRALLNASHLIGNKETLYRLLEAQQIEIPGRLSARDLPDLIRVLQAAGQPLDRFIVKPVVGTESRGVYRPGKGQTAEQIVEYLGGLPDIDRHESFLVMPFISSEGGTGEYCLDGIVVDGRVEFCACHEKTRIFESYPIHDRTMLTPPLNRMDQSGFDEFLSRFAHCFPLTAFVFHLEVRVDRQGRIIPIDLSFRPGGGLIFKSVMNSYGIDLRLAHMYCSLGMDDELRRVARAHHRPRLHTAIAAVFSNANTAEGLYQKLNRLMGEADATGGLTNYDFSNVSILSTTSQKFKPNVGLSICSGESGLDCLDRLNTIVADTAMSFVSPYEAQPTQVEQHQGGTAPVSAPRPGSLTGERRADPDETISGLISSFARQNPDTVAIASSTRTVSYAELDALSTQWARRLVRDGVGVETRVGLAMARSPEFIVAALAILKAGGSYVPLDKSFPDALLDQMTRDAALEYLITDDTGAGRLADFDGQTYRFDAAGMLVSDAAAVLDAADSATPQNLAYIVYTSGSTGTPKGVAVTREAVVNLVRDQDYFAVDDPLRVLHAASVSFDAATFEIWGPLLNGGRCVVETQAELCLDSIARLVASQDVNIAWFNASLFNTIIEDEPQILARMERVIVGGEIVSAKHFQLARAQFPDLQLVNGYGPTEATTFACCHVCDQDRIEDTSIPIGRPLNGVELVILDKNLDVVPVGVEGELCIGGCGLARGYIGNPALTAERFIPHPCSTVAGARLYRTGDRVRQRLDGRFEFIGRLDRQIKLRGFRVELDEVEQAIRNLAGVQDAIVNLEGGPSGGSLVARLKLSGDKDHRIKPDTVSRALRKLLPAFMIPTRIIIVPELERTPTGKRCGPRDAGSPDAMQPFVEAREGSGVMSRLAAIWAEVLELDNIEPQDDFFQLGGHSLSATRVLSRIKQQIGVKLCLRDIFTQTRLESLARLVEQALPETGDVADSKVVAGEEQGRREIREASLRAQISRLSDADVARMLRERKSQRSPKPGTVACEVSEP